MDTELAPVDDWPSPVRPSYAHENNWYSYKLNTIWLGNTGGVGKFADAAAHELSHYLMHVFTPYGAFLDELNNMQQNQVLNYCIEVFSRSLDKVRYPVYHFAKDLLSYGGKAEVSVGNPTVFRNAAERYVKPWSHSVLLENVMEANDTPNVRAASESNFLESLRAVEKYSDSNLYDDDHLFETPARDDSPLPPRERREPLDTWMEGEQPSLACVHMGWGDGRQYPVGAIHIIESLAQLVETFDGDTWHRLHRSPAGHPYLMLWLLANMKLKSHIEESQESFNRLLYTFRALCDLALFVPAGGVYGRLRPRITAWFDLQPGCRFLRAVDAIPKVGWVENLERDLESFQEAVCRDMGWTQPRRFLELGARLKHPEFLAHRDACRLRLEHPSAHLDVGLEAIEGDGFVARHLPLMYMSTRNELTISEEGAGAFPRIMSYFLPQLCRAIMLSRELNYHEMLPQHIEFEGLFSNIKSTNDWLELIFGAVPSLKPSNFQPYTA
jgi:hypothetical protein